MPTAGDSTSPLPKGLNLLFPRLRARERPATTRWRHLTFLKHPPDSLGGCPEVECRVPGQADQSVLARKLALPRRPQAVMAPP